MYNLVLIIHIIVALTLIGLILIQRGRSGGLVEALGGVESIFGTKTSSFLVKMTVLLAILFFLTSISLAYLSKQKGKSLMDKYNAAGIQTPETTTTPATKEAEIPDATPED
jgi:preprotein translocase subunit SecG